MNTKKTKNNQKSVQISFYLEESLKDWVDDYTHQNSLLIKGFMASVIKEKKEQIQNLGKQTVPPVSGYLIVSTRESAILAIKNMVDEFGINLNELS